MSAPRPVDSRRQLPAVGKLLDEPTVAPLIALYGREQVRVQARTELDRLRRHLDSQPDGAGENGLVELPERIAAALDARLGRRLRRVLNATGIFLHTNLGRAPLSCEVVAGLPRLLDAYCDLELDLESGRRSDRNLRAAALLCAITGAEAALVVNNNAAALLLVLAALARGREVVVSRGELVEIGGSFRIPDILTAAGARLREVGTTNRTHLADYEAAIGEETALLLKVFPSNYRISGYTATVSPRDLAQLAERNGVPLLVDEGSGLLRPIAHPQLRGHRSQQELVADGCDLVCGSGDKLLGGPQAGLLVGRAELVGRLRRHPLYRALRPDRMTFAALEEVLRRQLAQAEQPLDRLWPDPASHRDRLEKVRARLGGELVPADGFLGGGSAPEEPVPGEALAIPGSERLLESLRQGEPPVVGYLRGGRLLLDLRTIDPGDDEALVAAVLAAHNREVGPA